MSIDPLTPLEVDAVLRPSLATLTADLLALSDSLERMRDALSCLHSALADTAPPDDRPESPSARRRPPRGD